VFYFAAAGLLKRNQLWRINLPKPFILCLHYLHQRVQQILPNIGIRRSSACVHYLRRYCLQQTPLWK